ncbi:MAG TPA: M56 family metallopeptidase [Chitinophagaceae bacterium]|nr:M56 family metallopeptidase [Chitinophagaceae bacterium]
MPVMFQYLLKFSLSLGIIYLFYQFLLRRLTFYNWNRIYLLVYTALCFFLPLINITPALENNNWQTGRIASIIPAWQISTASVHEIGEPATDTPWNYWTVLALLLLTGTIVFLSVFIIRYISFLRIRRQATLLSGGSLSVYQVDKDIIPFSFGNAIFINHTLHNEEELREIIRHEFVHVRQKHSIDIIWAELLCMINWYNPFVWLLRKSIRQNLEFIADHQVIRSGLDKKQYQYMLLKVIGNNHFSIASQFNFSSLKKRIAMMNKVQTSKRQLFRLLLLLPAVAALLLAFRQKNITQDARLPEASLAQASALPAPSTVSAPENAEATSIMQISDPLDTIPVNEKGYQVSVHDNNGNCTIIIKDKDNKVVKKILMTDWNKDPEHYEELYGELPPPPPPVPPVPAIAPAGAPAAPPVAPSAEIPVPPAPAMTEAASATPPVPPTPPVIQMPAGVKSMTISNNQVILIDKKDKKETYDLNDPAQKAAFEKKYGKFLEQEPAPKAKPAAVRNFTYQFMPFMSLSSDTGC